MSRTTKSARATCAACGRSPAAAAPLNLTGPSLLPPMATIAQQLRSWTDGVIGIAVPAADLSMAHARAKQPAQKAAIRKAGQQLRDWREAAGLTAQDLAQAIDLLDAGAIERAESGAAALPFELVLRLAGALGRRDPIAFVMELTRSYSALTELTSVLLPRMVERGFGRVLNVASLAVFQPVPSMAAYAASNVGLGQPGAQRAAAQLLVQRFGERDGQHPAALASRSRRGSPAACNSSTGTTYKTVAMLHGLKTAIDAIPLDDGSVLVVELGTGTLSRVGAEGEEQAC